MRPQELSVQVVKYLNTREIGRLAQTSRHFAAVCKDDYLWNLIAVRRFGGSGTSVGGTGHLDLYRRLVSENSLNVPAEKLNIIWNNGQWWKIIESPESHSGKVALLNAAWWFDARCEIKGVPRGKYIPTWRVQFHQRTGGLDGIQFRVSVKGAGDGIEHGNVVSETHMSQLRPESPTTSNAGPLSFRFVPTVFMAPQDSTTPQWVELTMPPLDVGNWSGAAPYWLVEIEATDHTSTYKYGLLIDWFQLVPQRAEVGPRNEAEPSAPTPTVTESKSPQTPSILPKKLPSSMIYQTRSTAGRASPSTWLWLPLLLLCMLVSTVMANVEKKLFMPRKVQSLENMSAICTQWNISEDVAVTELNGPT
ncbi:uncharacterized protein EV422DRAFT_266365 [Fimicolochytrium jonesii]|uniref:uncharacterized protein n=1 Tax=Fimicolochytrium jonesii TaxID=1396493 RepID=UPI0022FDBCC1|nr:uncharacterized protein EV422DRAFT_266365 [Fimicolochytrium jonesii]KAI8816938.1 hypothetical protein EV422DRAFT_266365 [Fimicolochytrium jonesii]